MVGGWWVGGGWINPLQPLPQGLVLTFDFDFDFDFDPDPDPELDNLGSSFLSVTSCQTLSNRDPDGAEVKFSCLFLCYD